MTGIAVAFMGGCASKAPKEAQEPTHSVAMTQQLDARSFALEQREAELRKKEGELARLKRDTERMLTQKRSSMLGAAASGSASGTGLACPVGQESLPPNAKPGECYVRVWVEPQYKKTVKRVLTREEGEKIDIIPGRYEWVTERIEVSPASTKVEKVPAVYGTEKKRIKIKESTRTWRVDRSLKAAPVDKEILNSAQKYGVDLNAAQPGTCFVEHYLPAVYRAAYKDVEISPPTEELVVVPAQYRTVQKKVLVKEGMRKVMDVPAVYETVTEKVLEKPAHTMWKKTPCTKGASCPASAADVMCLVEVPATYKTITKRLLKAQATTKTVEIPAEYKTVSIRELVSEAKEVRQPVPARYEKVKVREKVKDGRFDWQPINSRQYPQSTRTGVKICLVEDPAQYKMVTHKVVKQPASTRKVVVPAQYKTVKVRKMVTPPQERRVKIAAEYKTVPSSQLVTEGRMEWRAILCETNMTKARIIEMQRALKQAGFYSGKLDGVVGGQTRQALNAFQRARGLPVTQDKYLDIETLRALGVWSK